MMDVDGKASSSSGDLNLISPLLSCELNANDSSRADTHRGVGLQSPTLIKHQWQEARAPNRVALTGLTLLPLIFLTSNPEETGTAGDPPPPIGSFRRGAAMSKFSTMTTAERKLQAAAICKEVQALEDVEMDLGKKVSVPKDVMLEELSLTSNRGSRLFKMRQKRSDKYTFESVHRESGEQINTAVVSQSDNGVATESSGNKTDLGVDPSPKVQPETLKTRSVPSPNSIAPGYGAPLKDVPPEKFNKTAVPKSYRSPWEQPITHEPAPADAPEPEPRIKPPAYKSFNRVAIPFGGFTRTPAPVTTLQVEPLPDYPQLRDAPNRPSFNRAAPGWVSTVGPAPCPAPCPAASLKPVLIPESDDL
ncbi:myozenin-2-like [Antennarius striatus]|uniref:myozenin-2-like n=1 Tax=Antennarius striatus TaxID=241820 RepID=UPI0035B182DE